jgi:hypothetical protein
MFYVPPRWFSYRFPDLQRLQTLFAVAAKLPLWEWQLASEQGSASAFT